MNHDHVHPLFRDLLNALCKGPGLRPCASCSSPHCGPGVCRFDKAKPEAANDPKLPEAA